MEVSECIISHLVGATAAVRVGNCASVSSLGNSPFFDIYASTYDGLLIDRIVWARIYFCLENSASLMVGLSCV